MMINRTTKLRWRRRFRRSKQTVEDISLQAEENLDRNLFRRLSRVNNVRRFLFSWICLIVALVTAVVLQNKALSSYYQEVKPIPGGVYTEGILGSFTNANPLYATGGVDGAVSRLLFGSLLKYDNNNNLIGDLAESWSVDSSELRYTVKLKNSLRWHDGAALTADDVIYTYEVIQNPDAKSPLQPSWQGIKLEKIDDRTVVFTLPNTLSSFPHALTNGIVPRHLLQATPPSQLRSVRFNTVGPVGSGPFRWDTIEVKGTTAEDREENIGLVANADYYGGKPALDRFVIRTFRNEKQLLESFQNQQLTAVVGLSTTPDTLADSDNFQEYSIPLAGEVVVFFNTRSPVLSDVKVRQALVRAADAPQIIRGLDHPVIAANSPLLSSHIGYDKTLVQFETNIKEANALLDAAGWLKGGNGIRSKDGQPLEFEMFAQSTSEYHYVTQTLQKQWKAVGVNVKMTLPDDTQFKTVVANHGYDALLYGISLGTDPDVFAYWHSSQSDPRSPTRLNFSEYKSSISDRALEAGRTRSDPSIRAAKYRPFLAAWRQDAPALILYQPRLLYITRGQVYGFEPKMLNNATERYGNVEHWMIRTVKSNR